MNKKPSAIDQKKSIYIFLECNRGVFKLQNSKIQKNNQCFGLNAYDFAGGFFF